MRRLPALVAILALGSPASGGAQSLWVGAKTGANRTTWTGDFGTPSNPYGHRTGLAVGPTVAVAFGEVVALQLEALYTQKGATSSPYFQATVTYLELPLLVGLALPLPAIDIRLVAMAGFAPAVELSCGALASGGWIPEEPPPPPTPANCISWRTEPRDLGVVLAGGVEVPLTRFKLTAELRRTAGRNNIAQGYTPLTSYNRAWSLLIGTAFPIRR